MVSQSRISGAREEALSGLEGLLEVVDLELMAESIMAGTRSKSRRERVPDFRSCNTELQEPNEVGTNGAHNRLVFESLRERVE